MSVIQQYYNRITEILAQQQAAWNPEAFEEGVG